jgi:PqqD family protein of HPr-rel-A system
MGMGLVGAWRRRDWRKDAFVEFEEILIVFHRASGKTHFLNATSACILDLLSDGSTSLSAIVEGLSFQFNAEFNSTISEQVGHHLQRLEALGLVERC